jgi:hypothetical protein
VAKHLRRPGDSRRAGRQETLDRILNGPESAFG